MTRHDILATAEKCVCGEREESYGSPESNFGLIAELWNVYLNGRKNAGTDISASDVAAMMSLLKLARIASGQYKSDNWVDLAGYAACGGEIEGNQSVSAEIAKAHRQEDWGCFGDDSVHVRSSASVGTRVINLT